MKVVLFEMECSGLDASISLSVRSGNVLKKRNESVIDLGDYDDESLELDYENDGDGDHNHNKTHPAKASN